MWKLFDQDGDGSIECNELSETLKRLGQNWNTDDIDTFFRDIDKSVGLTCDLCSGTIHGVVAFIESVLCFDVLFPLLFKHEWCVRHSSGPVFAL